MTRFFKNPVDAVSCFMEDGGAMLYFPAGSRTTDAWCVGHGEEIAEMIAGNDGNATVKDVTADALHEAGMSEERISEVMGQWND